MPWEQIRHIRSCSRRFPSGRVQFIDNTSSFGAAGVESILRDKVLRARHRPYSSDWMAAFRQLMPHFEGEETLLMDMRANCRHNGIGRSNGLPNSVRPFLHIAAK